MGNLLLEPGFVALASLAPGDEITVRLGTWLMDLQEAQGDGDGDGAEFVPGVVAIRRDGAEFPLTYLVRAFCVETKPDRSLEKI